MIEPIQRAHFAGLVKLTCEFYRECPHVLGAPDPASINSYLDAWEDAGVLVGVADTEGATIRGTAYGVLGTDWVTGVRMAQELVWYKTPHAPVAGAALLDAFVAQAHSRGARKLASGFPIDGSRSGAAQRLLVRNGFVAQEIWYTKEI